MTHFITNIIENIMFLFQNIMKILRRSPLLLVWRPSIEQFLNSREFIHLEAENILIFVLCIIYTSAEYI